MNLTVYVPREMVEELGERARRAGLTPSLFVQSLLRRELAGEAERFSDAFAALAGSWEDRRTADEIVVDIKRHRRRADRVTLR
jgi:hypothetical protein